MKKYFKIIQSLFILVFFINSNAQHTTEVYEDFSPAYILISTFHLTANPELDMEEWKKVEQEYFDKVTNKNKYILGAGVHTHVITPDDSEVIFYTVYNSLADLEKAEDLSSELINEGWPTEQERTAYFNKQDSFYTGIHSDEIATSLPYQKDLVTESDKPLIYYVRKNKSGNGGSGYDEFFDNIIMKNIYIRGFYTFKHRYGANSTDATEIAVFENFADYEAAFIENDRLVHEYWSDETERKKFFKEFRKIFSGHGDFIYQNIPSLAK